MADATRVECELGPWLVAAAERDVQDLHGAFCGFLLELGLPVWRSALGLERLHPEQSGSQYVWTAAGSEILDALRVEFSTSPLYLDSPVRVVDETGRPYRRRLDADVADMPLLLELKGSGATDYVIFPLPFLDQSRTATISFATKAPAGFAEGEIDALKRAGDMLSPYAERRVLKRIAIDLLDTYIGRRSGERVYSGALDRGATDTIEAAIVMADLRGFTRLSDEQALDTVIATLNQFFEAIVGGIEAEEGEVLKFIGDGVLAIFPSEQKGLGAACCSALAAARSGLAALADLNAARATESQPPLAAGLALHAGEIAWGNIGSRLRLDFTAIGPAVNHTSRLLELAKRLGLVTVVSERFRSECGVDLPALGVHRLRNVVERQPIYTLPGSR